MLAPTREQFEKGLLCGALTLKLARTQEDLRKCQRLRFEIFYLELNEGLPENRSLGLDIDVFDEVCDHLMVLDNDKLIGTYRLLWGPNVKSSFYSETEFNLLPLFRKLKLGPENFVELGRGCIHKDYRKQSTLMTLFWGIKKYLEYRGAQHMFGCGSLPGHLNNNDAEATFEELRQQNFVDESIGVHPLPANQYQGDASKGKSDLPDLIKFYLQFGAKILGRPAHDAAFGCFDLLVYFDMQHLSEWGSELVDRFDKRLQKKSSGN